MTFVTNLLSIDEEIEFRVCSEGCRAGVLGGCVVVKDTVVIPLHIIHFLGLQIMLLEFDSDWNWHLSNQCTWQLRFIIWCICKDKYMLKIRKLIFYLLFWAHEFCWFLYKKSNCMTENSCGVSFNQNNIVWWSGDQNLGYSSATMLWLWTNHIFGVSVALSVK